MQSLLDEIFFLGNKIRITSRPSPQLYEEINNAFLKILDMSIDSSHEKNVRNALRFNRKIIKKETVLALHEKLSFLKEDMITKTIVQPKKRVSSPSTNAFHANPDDRNTRKNLMINVCKRVIPARITNYATSFTILDDVTEVYSSLQLAYRHDFAWFFKYYYKQHSGKYLGISHHFLVHPDTMVCLGGKAYRHQEVNVYQFCVPTDIFKNPEQFFRLIYPEMDDKDIDNVFFNNFVYVVKVKGYTKFEPILFRESGITV